MAFRSGDILNWFSTSYEEARDAILRAAEERGAAVTSHLNPRAKGVSGEDLHMDVVTVGNAGASHALIISSGTHGIEGYAGSALQLGLLFDGISATLPGHTVCHLVHAVNPFGFSHYRRVNEDNVDLNRNFVEFSGPMPHSNEFSEFHSFADQAIAEGRVGDDAEAAAHFLEEVGERTFQRALTMGQYMDPTAVYYGGREPTWSNHTWRRFLDEALPGTSLVVHMDLHTGLGRKGEETLIYTRNTKCAGFRLACRCYGKTDLLIPGARLTPDISGPIPSSFGKFEDNLPVIGVAPEYGTVPLNDMLATLIEENALWHNDDRSGLGRASRFDRMMNCFCPDDAGWRIGVWRQFRRRIDQTIAFLDNL